MAANSRIDPGHRATQVERILTDEDDVVLTKAGPGIACDPDGRPQAVTANSRVNPESPEPRTARSKKTPRDPVTWRGIIVDCVHLPAGCKERDVSKNRHAGPVKCNAWILIMASMG